jgi:hypothetical protein
MLPHIKEFFDHPCVDRLATAATILISWFVSWLVDISHTLTILLTLLLLFVRLLREIQKYRREGKAP